MKKILGILFLIMTVLIGLVSSGKIEVNKTWIVVIFIVQVMSWVGYISLMDIEKQYKIGLSALSLGSAFIIGLLYMIQ